MTIKTDCTIGGVSMSRKMVRMSVMIPSLNLPSAVSSLQLLGSSFGMMIAAQGKKYKILGVFFTSLQIDKDGEAKIRFDIDPESMGEITFSDLAKLKTQSVSLILKGGAASGQEDGTT